MKILIINGPNLNFLGIREPNIYGTKSYSDLINYLKEFTKQLNDKKINLNVLFFQSNHEGAIIDKIQEAYLNHIDGIIINPGAFTHYSYAIHDAIKSVNIKTVEVHLSNINEREEFRKISVIRPACINTFMGKQFEAILYLIDEISKE